MAGNRNSGMCSPLWLVCAFYLPQGITIVKSTKLLGKTGIMTKATFVCIYPFRRLAAVCACTVHTEHSARVTW